MDITTIELKTLTPRELEITTLLCTGKGYEKIATDLGVSQTTVKTHVNSIFGKLYVHDRGELIAKTKCLLCKEQPTNNKIQTDSDTHLIVTIKINAKEIRSKKDMDHKVRILQITLARMVQFLNSYVSRFVDVGVYNVEIIKEKLADE